MPLTDRPGVDDVGSRMTIRMRDPEGGYRDIVGILESPTSLRRKDGSLAHFNPDDIALWRKIIPTVEKAGKGSPLSHRIREIELAAAATWPAREQIDMGDWILRATGRFSMRANSALALGSPGCSIEDAICRSVAFYQERGLTPVIHVAMPTYAELDAKLSELGWAEKTSVLVMVRDIENQPRPHTSVGVWETKESPSDEWIALQKDEGAREIMESYPAMYAGFRIDGELVAVGRAANFEDWTVLTRIYVRPDYRRRHLGHDLVLYLLNEANARGATKAMLQVSADNASAVALYEKMGFTVHHLYKYRALQPGQQKSEC